MGAGLERNVQGVTRVWFVALEFRSSDCKTFPGGFVCSTSGIAYLQ